MEVYIITTVLQYCVVDQYFRDYTILLVQIYSCTKIHTTIIILISD